MSRNITPPRAQETANAIGETILRRTLRRHAAGVTIITVAGPAGFTATSFTSVSLEPPLVSFCVASAASVAGAVQRADRFAVHLLGPDDAELADRFARSGVDRFAGTAGAYGPDGLPVLTAAPAWLSARIVARHRAGDHVLVVGAVDGGGVRREAPALLRHDGAYATAKRLPSSPSPSPSPSPSEEGPGTAARAGRRGDDGSAPPVRSARPVRTGRRE
ncbi:flavin reductase [Streptomyces sp. SCUT-3]|uniref:flavin reductase family protein n=1 Tax=Streptomyces sp. SCUT-3 TaxID=2684469 RepID=UPI0015FE2621|nr:flavin reductase family protein [Streptomyces sp. SCUT-3]QMV23625.1 flavin reductase [Streptomyces sp. SCUT-3]